MGYSRKKIIIAVDGFSSCGKSTFARMLAARLGYIFIDTGAMYRAVTLCALRNGAITPQGIDEKKLEGLLEGCDITFRFDPSTGGSDIYLGAENVEDRIRSIEVSSWVSPVSRIAGVREKLVAQQQAMGADKGIVMDGRDIGTVVFPGAELKIFMTADVDVRARRRYEELRAKGEEVSLEEIRANLVERDEADQKRAIGPLRKASDAIVLDNSDMTPEEQMEMIEDILRRMGVL